MWYVGLDVHLKSSAICVLNEHGREVRQAQVSGPWARAVKWLAGLGERFAVCFEASCGY